MTSIRHIALFVPELREAEAFYKTVFGLKILMREAQLDDSKWYTLPPDKGWDDAEAAGIDLVMVALKRDAFILALFQGKPHPEVTIMEIGISMAAEEIAAILDRLPEAGELVESQSDDLMFIDPYGYRWHLWPVGVAFQSNGEGDGRWLEV